MIRELRERKADILIYLGLTSLVWLVFGQCVSHDFVAYDDQNYVYENPLVTRGITVSGIRAAFLQPHARNWHPLTTLSHMLDCQLFGLNPAGHHFINVLLHTAAVLLLFGFLRHVTNRLWLSAFVAAVFAIHPLRVESVAWVAERKDVLSACFFMLTLHAYASYANAETRRRYLGVMFFFALGLMAKPMLVTMPLLLLLLDYWPLERWRNKASARLIVEKIPLLCLSLLSGIATIIAQKSTIGYADATPLLSRIANAANSCLIYVDQMFWPTHLAVFYPQTANTGVLLSLLILSCLTIAAICLRRHYPFFFVGWFWYLVALLPVIGLIQVGLQAHSDRYTYLPHIGLYLALAFIAPPRFLAVAAPGVLAALTWLACQQAATWRNTETLWQHAAAVTTHNDLAEYNLAGLAMERRDIDAAILHYEAALASSPEDEAPSHLSAALLHNSLGVAFSWKGMPEQAALHYRKAIELRDDFADAHTNLANLLVRQGDLVAAIEQYRKARSLPPETR